ncbi:MAG TPA: hypothetical protein VJV79_30280 [Polyangiaceae bacterium]|nr:hypothetical protein [Polyangiaceae bacterium]
MNTDALWLKGEWLMVTQADSSVSAFGVEARARAEIAERLVSIDC